MRSSDYAKGQAETVKHLSDAGASVSTGTCVGYDWDQSLTVVNVGGSVLSMPWDGAPPWIGDRVRVLTSGGQPVAQLVHGSAVGTVVSVDSGVATVFGDDDRTYLYPHAASLTLVGSERVRLDHGGRLVVAEYAAEPPGSDFEVPAAPPGSGGSVTFVPTDSGSWRDGAFRSGDAEANEFRVGAYYFGQQIRDSIPDSATVTSMVLDLTETFNGDVGTDVRLGTHDQGFPASQPSITGSIDVPGSGRYNIMAFADALKLGTALGVGFELGYGYQKFSAAPGGGRITATWTV